MLVAQLSGDDALVGGVTGLIKEALDAAAKALGTAAGARQDCGRNPPARLSAGFAPVQWEPDDPGHRQRTYKTRSIKAYPRGAGTSRAFTVICRVVA